jgi:hypothetical protein
MTALLTKNLPKYSKPGASGGLCPRDPLTGLCPGPAGDLKRSPDPSPTFVPPNAKSFLCIWFIAWRQGDTTFHMFVLKMYVQIMSLSVLLCNVCVCYVYILKMSKKIKVKKKTRKTNQKHTTICGVCLPIVLDNTYRGVFCVCLPIVLDNTYRRVFCVCLPIVLDNTYRRVFCVCLSIVLDNTYRRVFCVCLPIVLDNTYQETYIRNSCIYNYI